MSASDELRALRNENAELRSRLEEAEETLKAIHGGEVDALVIQTGEGPRVYTVENADTISNRVRGEMLSQVQDAVISYDSERRVTYMNAAAEKLYDVVAAQSLGRSIDEVYTTSWLQPGDEADAAESLDREGSWCGEALHRCSNGRTLDVESSLTRLCDLNGLSNGVLAVIRDVAERRKSQQALKRQSDRLRLLWEAASILLSASDPDSMMQKLFEKVRRHFEVDTFLSFSADSQTEELQLVSCGGVPDEVASSMERIHFNQAICGIVAARREPLVATNIQESDDPVLQMIKGWGMQIYACNPLIAGDRLIGTLSFASRSRREFDEGEIAFFETISHYVTIAFERMRLVQGLLAADRRKDEFLAVLAHELRNPLAPIRSGLEVMRLARDKPETVEKVRLIMERQTKQLVTLIDDLLDVSRITQGKLKLRTSEVNLLDIVASAVEASTTFVEEAGHEFTVHVPPSPIRLEADPGRLAQVISNLINNAAKYTPEGGKIDLSVELADPNEVVISVKDTGIGIPEENQQGIFEMFAQIDRPIEKGYKGLGIGLTLVKTLVEMHGGRITVHSEGAHQGSDFRVMLPLLPSDRAEAGPGAEGDEAGASSKVDFKKVLVVDDNESAADMLALEVQLLGHEVRMAHDGREAVETAEKFGPHIILMDLGMPRMSGVEAAGEIRRHQWGHQIKIVALTGWGQDEDKRRTREAGFDGHLVKPVDPEDLKVLLASVES